MRALGILAASVVLPLWLTAGRLNAQEVVMDAGRLAHELDRLSNTVRVLYIAAHPDDENTRLLAYLANGRHVRAAYLSLTRGGGGQNLIGREQDSLLDSLRTQELLAARRLDGAEQRFTRARDFGYSKSAAESLAIWGHDAVLSDVVFALRSFRPDVIITRFDEQLPNHGHHTASYQLAREAFSAAADPARFPEQVAAGWGPWQARRLVYNWPFWRKEAPPSTALSVDVGGYDPRLGLSYGELAARSRSQHKSQGFGAAAERGVLEERFVHVLGAAAERDLLDGIEPRWSRFGAAGTTLDEALARARQKLHRDQPERALPALVEAHRALAGLPANDARVSDARARLERLMLAVSGLFVRASAAEPRCTPGGPLVLKLEVLLRRPASIALERVSLPDGQTLQVGTALALHDRRELSATLRCPEASPISTPYWLREPPAPGAAVALDQRELLDPEGPAPLSALLELRIAGVAVSAPTPLVYVWTDRVHGERERRVMVVPPATVTPAREAVLLPDRRSNKLSLRVRAGIDGASGRVLLGLPPGYRSEPEAYPFTLARAGDEAIYEFVVTPEPGADTALAEPLVEIAGKRWSYREDVLDYPHVPLQLVIRPARVRLSPLMLTRPRGVIGYVDGSGDSTAADLAHIGAEVEPLSDAQLLQGDLDRFAAILIGVRAYNTRDVLRAAHTRLMRYVERGGTVVTQYVTRSSLSPLDVPVGPYPLDIGRGRVTDETATISVVDPASRLLRVPNRIGPEDWSGWIQERGLYFGERWDERYKPLIELRDPDEPPQRGAILYARHGRGRYVYTGLSFFRQLPAGVPGAYRLLVNLLAREQEAKP